MTSPFLSSSPLAERGKITLLERAKPSQTLPWGKREGELAPSRIMNPPSFIKGRGGRRMGFLSYQLTASMSYSKIVW